MDFTKQHPPSVNVELLREQLGAVFSKVTVNSDYSIVHDVQASDETTIDNIIAAHDHTQLSIAEQILVVQQAAKDDAGNIPNWATWTKEQALNWHDTNIGDLLPVADLAEANALLATMATEQRNLMRMVIAMRNQLFPELQGS